MRFEPRRRAIEEFADVGGMRRSARLARLWEECFPLILPPAEEDGLGVALLDSNADSNFSFTNALGMISAGQARRLTASLDAYPKARWIVALHHHLTEYPAPVEAFAERIGTALINGAWFLRVLRPYAARIVVMHGHRHIDWIGTCGRLKLISAPSPVMAGPGKATRFYVHSLAAGPDGSVRLLEPERVEIEAAPAACRLTRIAVASSRSFVDAVVDRVAALSELGYHGLSQPEHNLVQSRFDAFAGAGPPSSSAIHRLDG